MMSVGLPRSGRKKKKTDCQTEESKADCLTRKYQAKLVDTCHRIPCTLRSHCTDKVPGEMVREM